jgi:hypothetical protein
VIAHPVVHPGVESYVVGVAACHCESEWLRDDCGNGEEKGERTWRGGEFIYWDANMGQPEDAIVYEER